MLKSVLCDVNFIPFQLVIEMDNMNFNERNEWNQIGGKYGAMS